MLGIPGLTEDDYQNVIVTVNHDMTKTYVKLNANTVKALREQTGALMMDCKKALRNTDGCWEDAIEWLKNRPIYHMY